MALTKDFLVTVKERAQRDSAFRDGLLLEALESVLRGELELAKILLRDYINATEGFESVGRALNKSPKSLMRMLGSTGNPSSTNIFSLTRHLQEASGLTFSIKSSKRISGRNTLVAKKATSQRPRLGKAVPSRSSR